MNQTLRRLGILNVDPTYFVYLYDGLNRPSAIQQNGTAQIASFVYNAQGTRGADARYAVGSSYGYDAVDRLATLGHTFTTSTGNVGWTFGRNPASQITSQGRTNDLYAFNAYTSASTSYAVNGLNQYAGTTTTTSGGTAGATLVYDSNGNLTSDGTTSYVYDVENRLVSASSGVTLDYDPAGRLWQMTSTTATVRFQYDGDALVEERDGSGALLRRYVHGTEEDDPLVWYEGSGLTDPRSFQVDHQGSIVSIGNADGTLRTIDSYDEYGLPGTSNDGRFQYTGQAWLPALGLYYYKARMYSPKLGRFLQTDPIGYKDQVDLYLYVANDPIDRKDPSGETWRDVGNIILGTGEAVVGTIGIVVGSAGVAGSGALEGGSLGVGTPIAVPGALASGALVVGSVGVGADGLRRIGNGINGLLHGKPTISEARRGGPGPYHCSNPTCDAPHSGTTGTTECPDCDGKRKGGGALPGPKPRNLPPAPRPRPRPDPKPKHIKIDD